MKVSWAHSVFSQRLGFGGGYAINPDPPRPFNHHAKVVRPESTDIWLGWESPLADIVREDDLEYRDDVPLVRVSADPLEWHRYRWIASSDIVRGFKRPKYLEGALAFKPLFNAARRLLKSTKTSIFLVPSENVSSELKTALRDTQHLLSVAEVVIHFDDGLEIGPIMFELWEHDKDRRVHVKNGSWLDSSEGYSVNLQ